MKIIYGALLAQLKTEVPELKWIDLDEGQLDGNGGERPAIAFPAALIGINFLKCDTIYVVNCFQKFVSSSENPPVCTQIFFCNCVILLNIGD